MPNNKAELTIILTLKDRVPFTYRWMKYMNDIKCPYKILIADGGLDSDVDTHLRNTKNYPDLDYTYIRYPFDKDLHTFYKKLIDVINRVETPYMLFADNDDFYLLDHFSELITFLNINPDFVSCGGDYVLLNLLSKKNDIVNSPLGSNYIAYSYNQFQSIVYDSGAERISYFLENVERQMLWWVWSNIHRVAAVKGSLEIFKEYEFKEVVAFEIHFHLNLLANGKYKQINRPYYIRQNGTSQSTSQLNEGNNLFTRFIKNNTFFEIEKSVNRISLLKNEKDAIITSYLKWFAEAAKLVSPQTPGKTFMSSVRENLDKTNNFVVFYSIRLIKQLIARNLKNDKRNFIRIPLIEKYILNKNS